MEILKVTLTSVLSAAALFLIAKVIGHKQMSQLDLLEYITGIMNLSPDEENVDTEVIMIDFYFPDAIIDL